jgi:hypothetical protein
VSGGRRGDLVGELLDVFHASNRTHRALSDEVQRLDYEDVRTEDVWTMKTCGL